MVDFTNNPILGEELTKHCGVSFDTDHIVSGKGGFWVRGHGFFTYAKARRLTGLPVEHPRPRRPRISAYGDYATLTMINGIKQ